MSFVGLAVVAAVLLAATAAGLWRRHTDGRMRSVTSSAASTGAASGGTASRRAVSGDEAAGPVLTADEIGAEFGSRATFVQFSSAFCSPCRTTRLLLGQVAGELDGVVHAEIDAEHHLELVRRLDITRTPTVLVLDATGREVRRATGVPRRTDALAAVALASASPIT
ncbi:thioredoxin family protein [Streptodolium elevatio]